MRRDSARRKPKNYHPHIDILGPRLRPLRLEPLETRRMLAPFSSLPGALDQQLAAAQNTLNNNDLNQGNLNSLPIIGPQLGQLGPIANALNNSGIEQQILNEIDALGPATGPALQTALYDALGPGGANVLGSANYNAPNNQSQPGDIHITQPFTFNSQGQDPSGEVEFRLHEPIGGVDVNLAQLLPNLPIQFQATNNVAVFGSVDVEMAIEFSNGAISMPTVFLCDSTPGLGVTPAGAKSQLMVSVTATVSGPAFTGYVGFFEGSVALVGPATSNQLIGQVYVSSLQPAATVSFGGSAYLDLSTTVAAANDSQNTYPSVNTEITLSWLDLSTVSSMTLSLNHLTVNLNGLFQDYVQPILNDIEQYTEPVISVVNVLNTPIPVISSLPGANNFTLIDLLENVGALSSGEVAEIESVGTFANEIQTLISEIPGAGGFIDFGSYTFSGSGLQGLPDVTRNLANGIPLGAGPLSGFSLDNLENYLTSTSQNALQNIENNPAAWLQQYARQHAQDLSNAIMVTNTIANDDALQFPVMDDPASLFGLLFGQDVNLVTFNSGQINLPQVNLGFSTNIPIFGPDYIGISFNFQLLANLEIELGYDTQGLRDYLADPNSNTSDLLNGFYVQGPYGSDPGTNIGVTASTTVLAGGGINLGFASASLDLQGGVFANLSVTMNSAFETAGTSGKIYFPQLTANPLSNLASIVPGSSITANLSLVGHLHFLSLTSNFTIANLASVTLWDAADAVGSASPPVPSLDGLSATEGPMSGSTVTVYGTNLEDTNQVDLNYQIEDNNGPVSYANLTVSPFNVQATSFQVTIPPSPQNSYGFSGGYAVIGVPLPGGGTTSLGNEDYAFVPAPSVTSIGSAISGGGSLVAINGSGLLAVNSIEVNGQPAIPYSDISHPDTDSTIWFFAPGGAGTVPVDLSSPGGSCTGNLTYIAQPQVTSISPAAGPINVPSSAGETVTIYGQNFSGATGVLFYSGPAPVDSGGQQTYYPLTPISDTYYPPQMVGHALIGAYWAITVKAPYSGLAGTVDVIVETSPMGVPPPISDPTDETQGNWSSPTSADQFTYWAAPTIVEISPAAGPLAGGNQIAIKGTNLAGVTSSNSSVDFAAGNPGTIDGVVAIPDTNLESMTVTVPPSPGGSGPVFVILTTPGGADFDDDAYNYVPPPTFTSLAVGSGGGNESWGAWSPAAGGVVVTITGTNLSSVTSVDFGSVAGTHLSVNAAGTQLTVNCPPESAGEVGVSLVSAGAPGGNLSSGVNFNYEGTPSVISVSPTVVNAAGGTQVTITGTSLFPPSAVNFVDTQDAQLSSPALSIDTASSTPTQLVVDAPGGLATAGYYDYVIVKTPQGSSPDNNGAKVSFAANAPIIRSITPNTGSAAGTSVTISGSNLFGVSAIYFQSNQLDEQPASFTLNTSTNPQTITCTTPLLYPGNYSVFVTNGVGSNTLTFTTTAAAYITGVGPSSGLIDPGTLVTITGVNIQPFEDVVDFGGIDVTPTFTSNTEVQVMSPAPLPASYEGKTVNITITTNYGPTPISTTDEFTYVNPALDITGISPSLGSIAGGTTVTITGSYLGGATAVDFGGVPGTIIPGTNTDTSIKVTAPLWTGSSASPVPVTVVDEYGATPPSAAAEFSYYLPAPTISGLTPASGLTGGGYTATIAGTGLSQISAIDFGKTPANLSTLVYNPNGTVTVTVPPSPGDATGAVDLRVTNATGESSITGSDQFTYGGVPTILALDRPTLGPGNLGPANFGDDDWEIDIAGVNLANAMQVTFGTSAVTSFVKDIAGLIVLTVPEEGPGKVPVTVTTSLGISAPVSYTFITAPLIIDLGGGPDAGPTGGGTSVTIRGINLSDATAVDFGTAPATNFTFTPYDLSGQYGAITATSPSGNAGLVNITVTSPEGTSTAEPTDQFVYFSAPTVTGVSPASGPLAGGNQVAISVTGGGIQSVEIGGQPAQITGANGDGTIVYAIVPPGAALGPVDITVTNAGGTSTTSPADQVTYMAPPVISGLSRASGAIEGGSQVTITGSDFGGATEVDFGMNNPAVIISDTATQIVVTSPPSPTNDVDTVDVIVTAYDGTSAVNEPGDEFSYTHAPYITSLDTTVGLAAGGTTVNIIGDDLSGATAANFGGAAAASFTVNADGSITAVSPAGTVGTVGTVDVSVTTPAGTSDPVPADQFTYGVFPAVTGISPTSGSTLGGTAVTITGAGLGAADQVEFNGMPAEAFTINADGSLTAITPNMNAGEVDITVITPLGNSATSSADQFTFVPPPVIASPLLSPPSGTVYGGTPVTIVGTNLAGATAVDFGSTPATILSNTDNQGVDTLLVLSPEAANDSPTFVYVTVTTPYGTSGAYSASFFYDLPPVVTSVSPASGPAAGGTVVTITGNNLDGVSAVEFGGVPAAQFNVSGGTVTAVSPAGVPSTVDVTAVADGGPSATSASDEFTFLPPPSISQVTPPSGPQAGGTTITLTGSGLSGATSVDFVDSQGDDYAGTIQSDTDGQLVVVSPAYPMATTIDILVTATAGTSAASSGDQFNYVVVPTVSGISPSSGFRSGGDAVTITGTNLSAVTAVDFGNTPSPYFVLNADGSLTAISPTGSDGTVDVAVVANGAPSPASPVDQFTYLQPAPVVTGVSPAVGAASGGETVAISGADLDNASAIYFGGVQVTSFTTDTATQITATVPAGTLGTVDITVTTSGGTSGLSSADQFTGMAAPAVSGLDIRSGPAAGGTEVTLSGTDLEGVTGVKFGLMSGTILQDTGASILAESPAGTAGMVDVTVTTPYGTSATSPADQFTYVAPPATAPASYAALMNTTLTVTAGGGVLAGDTDPRGLPLTAILLTTTANGTLSLGVDGSFTYMPNSGYLGTDTFTYQATNGIAVSVPTTVTLTVSPVTLSWTSGQTGNWTDPQWGMGAAYPNAAFGAGVAGPGSTVNVDSNQRAYGLSVQSGGQVSVGPGAVLSVTTATSVTGGTLSVDPAGLFSTGAALTLAGGSVTGGPVYAANYQLNGGLVSASLNGPGGVTIGGGTVTMSGMNTYAGATTVSAGMLIAAGPGALPSGSSLIVGAGANLYFGAPVAASSALPAAPAAVLPTALAAVLPAALAAASPQIRESQNPLTLAAPLSPAAVDAAIARHDAGYPAWWAVDWWPGSPVRQSSTPRSLDAVLARYGV
jgi:autotransporter-associated beta strand protein